MEIHWSAPEQQRSETERHRGIKNHPKIKEKSIAEEEMKNEGERYASSCCRDQLEQEMPSDLGE